MIASLQTISNLDISRTGAHGLDLVMAALYSLTLGMDEDEAAADHWLVIKPGNEHLYAPGDGLMTPVPRLKDDDQALQQLTKFVLPPLCIVRPPHVLHVYYGFGVASGKQFGMILSLGFNCRGKLSSTREDGQGICFRVGLWSGDKELESSNTKS